MSSGKYNVDKKAEGGYAFPVSDEHPQKTTRLWHSKRFWSGLTMALSGTATILLQTCGGNPAVAVVAASMTLVSGVIATVFGIKDSGNKIVIPHGRGTTDDT